MRKNRRMKVSFDVCLILILGMLAYFFMDTPRGAIAAGPTTWRFATLQSPQNPLMVEEQKGFNKITELTQGRIKFQVQYGMESGFQAKQYVGALEKGLLDGASIATSASAIDYPWLGVFGVPFLCPDTKLREAIVVATKQMLDEFSDKHGIVPLAYPLHMGQWTVIYSRRNIKSLADFKGMLIRCYDPSTIALTKALGAIPTSLQKSEIYMGLQKGTIDGAWTDDSAAQELHLDEACKYVFQVDTVLVPQIVGISKKAWDKVSAEDQKIVRDVMREWDKKYWSIINDSERQVKTYDYSRSHGMTIILPPDDVKTVFSSVKNSMAQNFLATKDVKNKQVMNLITETLKKNGY